MSCPCRAHATMCRGLEKSFFNGMVVEWHGRGMACVNQTRPHCVNQMGKTDLNFYRHGMAGERNGRGMGTAWCVWISLRQRARFADITNRASPTRGASYMLWISQIILKPTRLGGVCGFASSFQCCRVLCFSHWTGRRRFKQQLEGET
jgi:hypothetical protein